MADRPGEVARASSASTADVAVAVRPEAAFPIRLVALDIDGTLVGEDLVIGPRTLSAVRAARDRGVHVALVTGRMTTSALRFARALDLVEPIVAYQGALIRTLPPAAHDPRLGRILAHRPLPATAAREVIAWSRSVGLEPHLNHLERFVVQADDPRAEDYSSFIGARALVVPDLATWIRRPISKVLAVGADTIPEAVMDEARRRFAGRAAVTLSHPRFLEFLAPGVSKALGVRHLARRGRVPLANVLAIGDQFNDLEMLAAVGHGAAMPTAPEAVRAAARYVARPVAEEGVADLIEHLVLASPADAARAAARLAREHATLLVAGIGGVTVRIVADDADGRDVAIEALRAGAIVALPTDTVYGIAVALDTPGGIEALFAAKDRPPDRAIMLLLADAAQAPAIGEWPPAAAALAGAFWPGGLTVVVPQREHVTLPPILTAGARTIGLRVPDHDAPRALAAAVGPIPTTSANRSGAPEAADAASIVEQLGHAVAVVLDGGPAHGGPPSTVVDCTIDPPRILREGAIARGEIERVLGHPVAAEEA